MTGWWASIVAAAAGTAFVLRSPAPLAEPNSCLGVFDLLAIIVGRTWRDMAMGSVLASVNGLATFGALLLFARALQAITSSITVAIAITLALACSAEFAQVLAPSTATVFVFVLTAWVSVTRARPAGALTLLALVAATSAPLAIPASMAAGWFVRNHGLMRSVLIAVAVMLPMAIVQLALPQGPPTQGGIHVLTCLMPLGGMASLLDALRSIGGLVVASPLAAACAALGLFSLDNLPKPVTRSLLPLTIASLWGQSVMPGQPASALAPAALAFWMLAAAGLAELSKTPGQSRADRLAAIALPVALVALQAVGAHRRQHGLGSIDGHDRMTLTMVTSVVGALPRGAALVQEDAVTGLLTRSLPGRMRSADRFQMVPREPGAVAAALARGPVFVLPRSQRALLHFGFELSPATAPGVPALAEIRASHACSPELGPSPTPLAFASNTDSLALVADVEDSHDAIAIFLTSDTPLSIIPSAWPTASLRGIHGRTFDLTLAADRQAFADELQSYGLASWPAPGTRYVSRIETWRTPGSPLVLPIALGARPVTAIARAIGPAGGRQLRVCPSLPYNVRAFSQRP